VDVVHDDDQGVFACKRLEQLAKAPCDLLGRSGRLAGSERGADARGGELRFAVASQPGSHIADLRDDLGKRPVGDPLPVGEAAADEDLRVGALDQLARESRLADPGRPDDRCELRRAFVGRASERALQPLEFFLAPRRTERRSGG
jgi:hypothetical protein